MAAIGGGGGTEATATADNGTTDDDAGDDNGALIFDDGFIVTGSAPPLPNDAGLPYEVDKYPYATPGTLSCSCQFANVSTVFYLACHQSICVNDGAYFEQFACDELAEPTSLVLTNGSTCL